MSGSSVRALAQAYQGREEPEEKVAVVSVIHSEEAGVALHLLSWERSHRTQSSPW